ncbi:hypothetical protein Desdi_3415 [Desulfitobacterium dichloroeliminans LMG P-21439]|uniref:Uncharacterized protein n=1 Tax=Desulfitobacterium dichloroeliminans (strain LMG P-21439 / DCA1) TaxID=871963 RepID=L0FDS0_DESDL|nr:hypothetical protein [Desulfitobacterium dichloroeliminans]AGA70801.1 hypothetical protein Desdi_3415 [Desulfitobacterium dichloroeliminans LMG P-21439]
MNIQLTALGAIVALLWLLADYWEWTMPATTEKKIIDWKRSCYKSQIIVKFINQESIDQQERFAFSLRYFIRDMEREMGIPIHCEIELSGQENQLTAEELRHIQCLKQAFSSFTWRLQESKPHLN